MALGLKIVIQIDYNQGKSLWITDKTGAYDMDDNPTGWGPENVELNQSALALSIIRNTQAGPQKLNAVSYDVIYDAGADPTKETVFEFAYALDGYHTLNLFRLPALSSTAGLSEGDFFYYIPTSKVSVITGGLPIEVTDYEDMTGDTSVIQIQCEETFISKLILKRNELYKKFIEIREKRGGELNDTRDALLNVLMVEVPAKNAVRQFRSGLATVAQDTIETQLERYNIK